VQQEQDGGPPPEGRAAAAAAFQTFSQFLKELSSSNACGRIILTLASPCAAAAAGHASKADANVAVGGGEIKYVLLDASSKFAETLAAARAVVLASGTLAPLELLTAQLCRPHDSERLHVFTCGHVVAPERVLALGVGAGPGGDRIRLTHGVRDADTALDACGGVLEALCRAVPQGLVAFVPSFAYADKLRARWVATGADARMRAAKRVFYEVRDAAACDGVLRGYRAHLAASEAAGGLLVCVVGAKLSEGINFGDGLGRCVVAFGLPYPDLRDVELQERLAHIERTSAGAGAGTAAGLAPPRQGEGGTGGQGALGPVGREMYANMCMQAVNQCVGRAIRHVRDYAAVVLVDVRYTRADSGCRGVVAKLPGWLTQRWRDYPDGIEPAVGALTTFFASMRAQGGAKAARV
jgi:chromosome transmission fidelity protein 1